MNVVVVLITLFCTKARLIEQFIEAAAIQFARTALAIEKIEKLNVSCGRPYKRRSAAFSAQASKIACIIN